MSPARSLPRSRLLSIAAMITSDMMWLSAAAKEVSTGHISVDSAQGVIEFFCLLGMHRIDTLNRGKCRPLWNSMDRPPRFRDNHFFNRANDLARPVNQHEPGLLTLGGRGAVEASMLSAIEKVVAIAVG